uniref:Uncharacterized protein n=1 Tax=Chromera velia CCMP2878 TaxID=1169474 RepID=A0A0G4IAQ5_9ALVE|eukprot:Cvel_12508.t1-p1 / transcript=Cvel_12508.t1 / gene=Cvel_12508 / organism=Chromera_velia_CCMP2878 / gene_product=hypothetical protein / transcript_product=hypothetical protein / location=Cvel_scaffold821:4103-4516(+) / protein_length=138 / sequence_SO=supercontig / SO=protein_coding / is_pseudo=false
MAELLSVAKSVWGAGNNEDGDIFLTEAETQVEALRVVFNNMLPRAWATGVDVSPGTPGFFSLQALFARQEPINATLAHIKWLRQRWIWERAEERAGRRIELQRWLRNNPPPSERRQSQQINGQTGGQTANGLTYGKAL